MQSPVLAVRADAGREIGHGHFLRGLTLARAWQSRGYEAVFITACRTPALLDRLRTAGVAVLDVTDAHPASQDLEVTLGWVSEHPEAWLVLDGYHFDASYQRAVKDGGARLLVIDDHDHADHYCANVLLNQNLFTERLAYSSEPFTRRLFGPRYALIRPEFRVAAVQGRDIAPVARRLLVTLGGADPSNQTLKVLEALRAIEARDLDVRVVGGADNPHAATLTQAARAGGARSVLYGVDDMAALMAWADLAVSAAGSTCWEMACMGLPAVLLVLAENQRRIAEGLAEVGAAVNLGWCGAVDAGAITAAVGGLIGNRDRRQEMSAQARALVDGGGCDRVLAALGREVLSGAL